MTRPDDRRTMHPRPRKGRLVRVIPVVMVVLFGAFMVLRFVARPDPQPLPAKKSLAAVKPKDLAQYTTEMAIGGGATAGVKSANDSKRATAGSLIAPPEPDVTSTAAGVDVKGVRSVNTFVLPRDHAAAEAEAVAEARRVLVEKGHVQGKAADFPLEVVASREVAYTEWKADPKLREVWGDDDRGWVMVDVKLSHDALRVERAQARTAEVSFWFGTAFLVLLAGYGFLRLDMWTKGYLTLAVGLVVAGVAVGGVLALGLLVLK